MNQPLPILYSFRRCPYAMRARLALYSAKVAHIHREVDLKNKPAEMLAISPKGTVPVLQLPDGQVLEQSLDIMKWALGIATLPLEDINLVTQNDTIFKQALDRYKYPHRYSENREDEIAKSARTECELFLKTLEDRLQPFLAGDTPALADMAIFPFIRQFTLVEEGWLDAQPYPRLKTWLDYFLSSDLFSHTMHVYQPWSPHDTPHMIRFD